MARHQVFTIVTDIPEESEEPLQRELTSGPGPEFWKLTMLHFASFVIFDKDKLSDSASDFKVTRSKLVFECNIDGPVDRFLDQLAADPAIDQIYQHCVDYRVSDGRDEKLRYLKGHIRWPQLFHIGAPYRSAASIQRDREFRSTLDAHLATLMTPSLTTLVARSPAGSRERWTWDIVRPWVAVAIGVAGPALALWLGLLSRRWSQPWLIVALLRLFLAALALVSANSAYRIWTTSAQELRDRVRPWFKWAVAAIVCSVLVWMLWDDHRNRAVGLAVAFIAAIAGSVMAAVHRRLNERLVAIRSDRSDPSIVSVWNALRRHVLLDDEQPALWRRLVNWVWWPIALLLVWALIFGLSRVPPALVSARWLIVLTLTALFAAKAWWLSILVGWPAETRSASRDHPRIAAFRAFVPLLAFVALLVLTSLNAFQEPVSQGLLAVLVVVSIFSLWAIPLPSPPVQFKPLVREALADLRDSEDQDVQNHMSAVVALKRDHRFRVPVLKSFLWLLNKFFYRCWLPDLYRGKFFGVTTVQFAQWIVLDERNFLFLSNYDHSWTSYLDDFGLELTTGIQKIWGQGAQNPGTKNLVLFKDYARTTMVRHARWYRAYPGLTLRQVWNNEQIRRELARGKGEEAMVKALRRLGAAPKTLPQLPYARIN